MSDTAQIILAVVGTGVTLSGILAGLLVFQFRIQRQDIATIRQDIDNRHKEGRQDMAEIRQELHALHARIDNLYQALFSHKDPAA